MLPPLDHPERVAASSIRGYMFQTVGIALRWVSLARGELLLCEGDEDADHYLLDEHGAVRDVTQVQFKDIEGTLSVRAGAVEDSIFNFLRAYKRYAEKRTPVRFVFTTSAARARQQTSGANGAQAVQLSIDVLKAWQSLDDSDRTVTERALVDALKKIIAAARPEPSGDGKEAKAARDYTELEAAVAFMDAEPARWSDFLGRVDWRFSQGSLQEQLKRLEEVLSRDARTAALPAATLAARVVVKVIETSTHTEMNLRVLDCDAFDEIARTSATNLEEWATRARSDRLAAWVIETERRIGALEATAAAHDVRLEGHELRISNAEGAGRKRLQNQSARNLRYLDLSRLLRLAQSEVRVSRDVTEPLVDAVLDGSLVVVGDPGSGKTAVLAAVSEELRRRGHDVVVLTANSAYELGEDLVDTLEEWQGEKAGVLVVDALDQVRDYERAAALRKTLGDLVRSGGRWRVVASIRAFDLYRGTAIAGVFAGAPPTAHRDVRFGHVRHVAVSAFSDDELKQIESAAAPLSALLNEAPSELKALLRVPFYLSLAAILLDRGLPVRTLHRARSRIELLDLYWARRIADHAPAKDAREALLREICDRMINAHELVVAKTGLDTTQLYDLLTADVLREPPPGQNEHTAERVAFSHPILFDYAAARLWVPRAASALAKLLAADEQLLIIMRPSLDMALQMLWDCDATREMFWLEVVQLTAELKRDVGKIIGPTVGAREATIEVELEPLLQALASTGDAPEAADATLAYLVGALVPSPRDGRPIVGPCAGPWAQLADRVSAIDRPVPRQCCRRLLFAVTDAPDQLTVDQRARAGRAARTLFAAAIPSHGTQRWLLPDAIRYVCRTFSSDRQASAACLRTVLDPNRLTDNGYAVGPVLGREVGCLMSDPDLVEAIYTVLFSGTEQSTETTMMGGGAVLSISSNRRQDYEHGLYMLKEAFPAFVRAAPLQATRAMVAILEAFIEQQHRPASGAVIEGSFMVAGREVPVRTDYSEIWDDTEHENALAIADAWETRVAELATDPVNDPLVRELFAACVDRNRAAIVWRRWLKIATRAESAQVTAPVIAPLLESAHVLTAEDTAFLAGECLKTTFSVFPAEGRARIEGAILRTRSLHDRQKDADETVARLLSCVEPKMLVTADAQKAMADVTARGTSAPNRPRFPRSRLIASGKDYGTDDWLRDEGAAIGEEPDRTVRDAARDLSEKRAALPAQASRVQLGELLDVAVAVLSVLASATEGVHRLVLDEAWGEVAEAATRVAKTRDVVEDVQLQARVVDIALAVEKCPCPRPCEGDARSIDETVSWGNPHARGDAADAILSIVSRTNNAAALAALERLTGDPAPTVRYRAVCWLGAVARSSPSTVWRMAEKIVAEEPSRGVIAGLITGAFVQLAHLDANRVTKLLERILRRVSEGPGANQIRRLAYQILTDLHIAGDDARASEIVADAVRRPDSQDADVVVHRLRPLLELAVTTAQSAPDERQRAQALLADVVREAGDALAGFRGTNLAGVPASELERARSIGRCLDSCAKALYFASGAFDAKRPRKGREPVTDRDALVAFLDAHAATLQRLGRTAIGTVVHSVVETLEHLVWAEPRGAFLLLANTITSGTDGGYQYDSLAADAVVRIVTRFLAEHRELLQADAELRRALLDVLDIFVRVGWPQAQEITYGLHDIFR